MASTPVYKYFMTPYQALDCADYDNINAGLRQYIQDYTELLIRDPRKDRSIRTQYCNFVDTRHFLQHNPLLAQYFHEKKLKLHMIYFTLAWWPKYNDQYACPIHVDRPPVIWKMNWPIINMENTAVRFFKLKNPDQDIQALVSRTGVMGSVDRDEYSLPYEPFEETHRHRFDTKQPIIMNGQVAHDVFFYPGAEFPRIGMQAMFIKEPTHLLQ